MDDYTVKSPYHGLTQAQLKEHVREHFRVGGDPEFFLFNRATKKLESAHPYIKGTKKDPFLVDGGSTQLDGISVEININPSKTPKEYYENLLSVMKAVRAMIPKEFDIVPIAAVNLGKGDEQRKFFESLPDSCRELGCSPSFNINTFEVTYPADRPADNPYMFTGSGHIHVGFTKFADGVDFMKCPEFLVDVYNLNNRVSDNPDLGPRSQTDLFRKNLYGKRFEVRVKPYGVEVRSPANSIFSQGGILRIFGTVHAAVFGTYQGMGVASSALINECADMFASPFFYNQQGK